MLPLNFLVLGGVSAACAQAPVNPAQTYLVGSIPIKARAWLALNTDPPYFFEKPKLFQKENRHL